MQIVYERWAGLDVHKKSVVACLLFPENGHQRKERQTFSTMTSDLVRLRDWLKDHDCTCVAMESTGVFWKPIYNMLEEHLQVLVVNAQHIKAVPERKTDIKDAEWIADLLQHGLLRPSFIPPAWQRHLRDLTRSRSTLIEERSRVIARRESNLRGRQYQVGIGSKRLDGKIGPTNAPRPRRGGTDSSNHGRICPWKDACQTRIVGSSSDGSPPTTPSFPRG